MTPSKSAVPPIDEIVERALARAEPEEPGDPDAIDRTFEAVGMPDAPTLRALLLRSRTLHFAEPDVTIWGLGQTDGDGYDLVAFCKLYSNFIPLVNTIYGWSRDDQTWCRWSIYTDRVFEAFPNDAACLHAAFDHLVPGY